MYILEKNVLVDCKGTLFSTPAYVDQYFWHLRIPVYAKCMLFSQIREQLLTILGQDTAIKCFTWGAEGILFFFKKIFLKKLLSICIAAYK